MKKLKVNYMLFILLIFYTACYAEKLSDKIVITGDTMELKDHGNIIVFTGGVKFSKENSIILGDQMIYDKSKGHVDISGNVRLRLRNEEGETVLAKAQKAVYFEKEGRGRMWGKPEIIRFAADETGQVNLYAEELFFDNNKDEVRAKGNVRILHLQTETRSEDARFINHENKVILTGNNPVLFRKDEESMGEYHGDTITVMYKQKTIILDGKVRGWIRLAKKEQSELQSEKQSELQSEGQSKEHFEKQFEPYRKER